MRTEGRLGDQRVAKSERREEIISGDVGGKKDMAITWRQ